MSKAEILEELARLSPFERQEISRRLAELEDDVADQIAQSRAQELASDSVQPKTQPEVFRKAPAAL